jgi:hypothetical protein
MPTKCNVHLHYIVYINVHSDNVLILKGTGTWDLIVNHNTSYLKIVFVHISHLLNMNLLATYRNDIHFKPCLLTYTIEFTYL